MYKNERLRSQFSIDFHKVRMVGTGLPMGEPYRFWKQLAQQKRKCGRKCVPKISFSGLSRTVWVFLRKKLKNWIWYLISQNKGYAHFCRPTPRSLRNGLPPHKFIWGYFGKYCCFFSKNLINEKYSTLHFLQKRLYWLLLPDAPFPSKDIMFSHKWFFAVFSENTRFLEKLVW